MVGARWLLVLELLVVASAKVDSCSKRMHLARAEQEDSSGLRCWDTVKVPSCGGRCDSRQIADWEFPFKKSHHPVCGYGNRKSLMVRLRYCDPGVAAGTEVFHFVAPEDCRCKICSSQYTSCELLPPNSTLMSELITEFEDEYIY